jgi:hypothetical protein
MYDYTTKQIILCGFNYCHKQRKKYFAEMFYNFLNENIKELDKHALEYIYVYIQNQDPIWQEIKENVLKEIRKIG